MRKKVKIKDGKITVGKHDVRDMIRDAKDGYYAIVLKGWDRTIEQNNTLWMWIDVLKNYHGYDKQGMYDALIEAYSWTYTYRNFEGKPRQKKLTTSQMTVRQMSEFMESIVQHAAEQNVKLPMPKND